MDSTATPLGSSIPVTAIIVYEVTRTWRRTSKDLDYIFIDPTDWAVKDGVSRTHWFAMGGFNPVGGVGGNWGLLGMQTG